MSDVLVSHRVYAKMGRMRRIFVMTRDGRILTRYTGGVETRYTPVRQNIPEECRTRETLITAIRTMGYTPVLDQMRTRLPGKHHGLTLPSDV